MAMKRYFFEVLALVCILAGIAFFGVCVAWLARRDYVGAALTAGVGFVVIHVGAEMARLALAERS